MVHEAGDKGVNKENVESIYYVGQLAARLGVDELSSLIGKFPFNNQEGYLSVQAYLSSSLMKTFLTGTIGLRQVAAAA